MFNKRSTILILLTILCIGLTISSVSAIDNSQPADNLTVDESSTDQLGSVAFDDEDAKEWAASVKLEETIVLITAPFFGNVPFSFL